MPDSTDQILFSLPVNNIVPNVVFSLGRNREKHDVLKLSCTFCCLDKISKSVTYFKSLLFVCDILSFTDIFILCFLSILVLSLSCATVGNTALIS